MPNFSQEATNVFELASKLCFDFCLSYINSYNLLLSMAMDKECYAYQVLSRLGLDAQKAKSFVIETNNKSVLTLSTQVEEVIQFAKKVAKENGYKNICSHHLLLAIVKLCHKSVRQLLWDFEITNDKIFAAVNAMNHYGIGKEQEMPDNLNGENIKINRRIKNKELEREILKALSKF